MKITYKQTIKAALANTHRHTPHPTAEAENSDHPLDVTAKIKKMSLGGREKGRKFQSVLACLLQSIVCRQPSSAEQSSSNLTRVLAEQERQHRHSVPVFVLACFNHSRRRGQKKKPEKMAAPLAQLPGSGLMRAADIRFSLTLMGVLNTWFNLLLILLSSIDSQQPRDYCWQKHIREVRS